MGNPKLLSIELGRPSSRAALIPDKELGNITAGAAYEFLIVGEEKTDSLIFSRTWGASLRQDIRLTAGPITTATMNRETAVGPREANKPKIKENEGLFMNRTEVKSSLFKSIGYSPTDEILEVEFANGGIYQYRNFSIHHWTQFRQQESLGRYFSQNIRSKFSAKKVEPEHAENSTEAHAAKE
jgi:hypothetical protein